MQKHHNINKFCWHKERILGRLISTLHTKPQKALPKPPPWVAFSKLLTHSGTRTFLLVRMSERRGAYTMISTTTRKTSAYSLRSGLCVFSQACLTGGKKIGNLDKDTLHTPDHIYLSLVACLQEIAARMQRKEYRS
eukprot:5958655-Amphidinium_carterae.1